MSDPQRLEALKAERDRRQRLNALKAERARRQAQPRPDFYTNTQGQQIPSDLFEPGMSQQAIQAQLQAPGEGDVINPTLDYVTGAVSLYPDAPEGSRRDKAAERLRGYDKQTEAPPNNRYGSNGLEFLTKGVPNALRGGLADLIDNPANTLDLSAPIRSYVGNVDEAAQDAMRGDFGSAGYNALEAVRDGGFIALELAGAKGAGLGASKALPGSMPSATTSRQITPVNSMAARLNDALATSDIDDESIRLLERLLRTEGIDRDGVKGLIERVSHGSDLGPLPSARFKDVLIDELDGPQQNLKRRVADQLKGTANHPGGTGQVVTNSIDADLPASREWIRQAFNSRLGGQPLIEVRDQIEAELARIGREGYEPLLRAGPQSREGLEALQGVLAMPRDGRVMRDLKDFAMGEGVDLDQMIAQRPLEAAHWMQSKARKLSQSGDPVQQGAFKAYRQRLLSAINEAAPEYDALRKQFGDEYGNLEALEFGDRFLTDATRDLKVDEMARAYAELSPRQQEVAALSIRDALLNEATKGRKGQAPRLTRLESENTLQALRRVLGDQGDALAKDIEDTAKFIKSRTDIDPRTNSQTSPLQEATKAARETVQNPIRSAVGGALQGIGGDLGSSLAFGGAAPIQVLGRSANALGRFIEGDPSRKLQRLAELLEKPIPGNALGDVPPPRQLPENALSPLAPSTMQRALQSQR